jgi:hypothetical protein
MLFVICGFGWFLLQSWTQAERTSQQLERLGTWLNRPFIWARLLLFTGVIFLAGCYFITLVPEITDPASLGISERLLPLVVWATGLSAQTLLLLLYVRYAFKLIGQISREKVLFLTLLTLGLLFLGWWWVTETTFATLVGVGTGWYGPGVPIIELQLLLAWTAGMIMFLFMVLSTRTTKRTSWVAKLRPRAIDILVGILLWLSTIVLWQSTPLVPSWFVTEPTYPNFEHYPNSDAFGFDRISQSHLVGEGFSDSKRGDYFVRRPLLAFFHSILHIVGGQDYRKVVAVQIAVLALLPPLIYYLTATIHNRISGVIAAVLIMLREANSIAIADTITASHAKLLMSDLPTQFMIVCLSISAVAWIKRIDRISIYPLICGGFLGLTVLTRTEAALLFLPLLVISGLVLLPRRRSMTWLKNALLLGLGVILVLSPWLWRTWRLTGYFTIDSPQFYLGLLQRRSQPIKGAAQGPAAATKVPVQKAETPSPDLDQSPTVDSESDPIFALPDTTFEYLSKNLKNNAAYMLSYYLNGQVETFLILPTTFRPFDSLVAYLYHHKPKTLLEECCSLDNYVRRMPYWLKWDGKFPGQAMIPLTLILINFAIGVSVSWKRQKIAGWIPLILGISYIMVSSALRFSGGRFILPVDWTSLFYFSIGLAHFSTLAITSTTNLKFDESFGYPLESPELQVENRSLLSTPRFYLALITIFLIGCTLPLLEISVPQRYTNERSAEMLSTLVHSDHLDEATRQDLQELLTQGGVAITGRGLYPRYFPVNVGDPGGRARFAPRPYSYIGFYLTGPQSQVFAMPFESDELYFPNGSDVIAFVCTEGDVAPDKEWEVLAVAVFNPSGEFKTLLINSNLNRLSCSNP